jgi:EmrB/QacA subfamily drug resistance transporter
MSFVTALVTLDTTITGVILPSIGGSLHATLGQLEWVIAGYMLPFASLIIPAGAWADRIGRKRAVLVGISVFALGSLLCGVASSPGALNVARIIQGVGAALLPTASIAVIGHAFRGDERTRAFAVWGAVVGLAIVAGPLVGGLVTSWIGWRWAFLVNPPICAVLIVATRRWVEESKDPHAGRFDWGGVTTLSSALLLLTGALIGANSEGWFSRMVISRLMGAAFLFVCFVWIEKLQRRPMVNLNLFRQPNFLSAVVAMVGYAATAQILVFYIPFYLQGSFGFSVIGSGAGMLPFALPLFLTPRWGSSLGRNRHPGVLLTWGLALTAVGNAVMAAFATRFSYPPFAVGMILAGCGAGILNGETTKAFMAAVPPERSGMASGLAATVRFISLMVAVAVMGALLAHTTSDLVLRNPPPGLTDRRIDDFVKQVTAGDISGAVAVLPEAVQPAALQKARASAAAGIATIFLAQALIGLGASLLTRRLRIFALQTEPKNALQISEVQPALGAD